MMETSASVVVVGGGNSDLTHHQVTPQRQRSLAMDQQQQQQQQLVQDQLITLSSMTELTDEMSDLVALPKELILISLVSQEQALYNPKHENYRNTQHKDGRWVDIAENVGLTETQCKAKWKAMRDQYCRELKRSKFNSKANVKWKYFKELDFLRPYALSRNYRPRHNANSSSNNVSTTTNSTSGRGTSVFSQTHLSLSTTSVGGGGKGNLLLENNSSAHKFPSIKIETINFNGCVGAGGGGGGTFTTTPSNGAATANVALGMGVVKKENGIGGGRLLATSLNGDQFGSVLQQDGGQWTYLTATAGTSTTNTATTAAADGQRNMDLSGGGGGLMNVNSAQAGNQQQATSSADEVLYNTLVDCVNAAAAAEVATTNKAQDLHQQQQPAEEDPDEDPIHTFLNIESYFEKELIAMIQQDDILYNSFHPNYRNVKMKLEVWDEIARKLKKTVKQCRLKWKALRDQYIREHKRLKNRENAETLPRWKHYDALSFLQKFIKHKPSDLLGKSLIQRPKTEMDTDMEEEMAGDESPLHQSPLDGSELQHNHNNNNNHNHHQQQQQQVHSLPSLTGPHTHQQKQQQQLQAALQQQQQQQQQQQTAQQENHVVVSAARIAANRSICVVTDAGGDGGAGNVSAYDDMDIDNYIIGDDDHHEHEHHQHHHHHHQHQHDDDDDEQECDDDHVVVVGSGALNETATSIEEGKMEMHFPDYHQQHHGSSNNNSHHQHHHNNNNLSSTSLDPTEMDKDVVGDDGDDVVDDDDFADIKVRIQECGSGGGGDPVQVQAMSVNVSLEDAAASLVEESLKAVVAKQQAGLPGEYNNHQTRSSAAAGQLLNGLGGGGAVTATASSAVSLLKGGHSALTSPGGVHLVAAPTPPAAPPTPATTTTNHVVTLNSSSSSGGGSHSAHEDDDEVGAFFRAVAMKIRNAKMSPITFTDLQIDILRVINGSLRNH